MQPLIFPTKVDAWLVAVLLGAFAFVIIIVGVAAREADTWLEVVALFLMSVWPAPLVALLALPTRYELHADQLVVRSGVIRYRAPYRDIRSAVPSRAIWSAPAWSLDRLWVSRDSGMDLLISPRDKHRFLVELQRRAPHLRLDGDRLVS